MIFVSNWPALPTNGSPCSSSSAPGASPMNMSCASMLPTPNTTFLRDDARCGHLTHASARSRNAAKAAALPRIERRAGWNGFARQSEQCCLFGTGEIVFGRDERRLVRLDGCGGSALVARLRQRAKRFRRNSDIAHAARFQIFEMLNRRVEQFVVFRRHDVIVTCAASSARKFCAQLNLQ